MNDGSVATPPRDAQSSLTGLYEILLELGRGGMGTVHLARALGQAGFERLVVLKRMHAHLLSEPRSVRRFIDEARIAAQLHHANIVGIQQVGADDAGYFLVLDYVEGDSIDGLAKRAAAAGEKLPQRILARALLDGLSGLAAAHEATDGAGEPLQILHRDVSTQNLLVGRDGITRLTDFGIARDARASGATAPGRLVGKPLYMSPEYLRGEAIDVRVDVYGMGVTAWVAFAGAEPWPNASDAQLVLLTMQKGIPDLRERVPGLSEELGAVVMRAIHPDASRRYESARAMADAMSSAAELSGGLATQDEVAALVQRLVGTELAHRRKRVASSQGEARPRVVRSNRAVTAPREDGRASEGRIRAPLRSEATSTPLSPGVSLAVATPNVTGQPAYEMPAIDEEVPPPPTSRPWLPFAVAIAIAAVVAAVTLATRSPTALPSSPSGASSPSPSASASPPPVASPTIPASAPPPPATTSARPAKTAPIRPPADPGAGKRPPDGISTSNPYLR